MHIRERLLSEDGGVLTIAAVVLPILLLVSAGGVSGFGLFASHRELQRAADQAALAGGASLPVVDPSLLVSGAPFPLPNTDPVFELLEGATGQNLPRMRDLVPDPRAVACAVGSDSLSAASVPLLSAFEEPMTAPPEGEDGQPISTVCPDLRVHPRLGTDPAGMTPIECTNDLIAAVAGQAGPLDIDLLNPLLSPIQSLVNGIVRMPLNHALPAAFTPRVGVTTYSNVRPPLLGLVTGGDAGTLRASATALRRIKNAVVVPILPGQRLLIDLGLANPIDVMTDPVNLNQALSTAQAPLLEVLADVDARLNTLMGTFGLPCRHLLHNLRRDLRDIYDPPTGPAPSARDVVDAAVTAAERTAERLGESAPNPADPGSLAGEAFVLIGVTTTNALGPIGALQIPILDVALVTMTRAADGDYRAAVISAANAHGAFRATLVE